MAEWGNNMKIGALDVHTLYSLLRIIAIFYQILSISTNVLRAFDTVILRSVKLVVELKFESSKCSPHPALLTAMLYCLLDPTPKSFSHRKLDFGREMNSLRH